MNEYPTSVKSEERKAFCEALMEIVKIRLEPGHCYEQAVRMQEIAKATLKGVRDENRRLCNRLPRQR